MTLPWWVPTLVGTNHLIAMLHAFVPTKVGTYQGLPPR